MTSYSDHLAPETFAIFLFHGIILETTHDVRNYTHKHITLARFEEVLDDLGRRGTPISMDDVAAGGALPPHSFAITFDDGFVNNLELAAPALERRSVPATFYVTSDFVESNASSWIDMIEQAVEATPEFELELVPADAHRVYRTPEEKIGLLDGIRTHVKGTREVDPYDYANELRRQLGATELEPDPALDRKLTWDQVRQLHEDPLFIVGGHGRTHRILEHLDDTALAWEIDTSCALLEQHLGEPPRHYSYPEGLADCYSDRVISLLRERGVVCSPSAEPGVNNVGDDPFRLKRVPVV